MGHCDHLQHCAGGVAEAQSGEAAGAAVNIGRRQLLRIAVGGASLPPICALLSGVAGDAFGASEFAASAPGTALHEGGIRNRIVRDFSDPYIELLRLLNVAGEIEHALMIQYLYAAFSVKPEYRTIAGNGAPGSDDLLGVAIQEMQHLGKVNQLLVALGAAPSLIRESLPYEPDIYPFRFSLEPLSQASLAKYVWTEAPPGAIDIGNAQTAEDRTMCLQLERILGKAARPNQVGTLYDGVIDAVKNLAAEKGGELPELAPWLPVLTDIKAEGEIHHFRFFKELFLGTHAGFGGQSAVWDRPVSDPRYPSYSLDVDPTAYVGHPNQIRAPEARGLAWLGNMHYWIVLTLLAAGYSQGSVEHIALARGHMIGPFWSLARELSNMRCGMPFDPFSPGYARGLTAAANARLLARLLAEADGFERHIETALPSDYPVGCCRGTMASVEQLGRQFLAALGPTVPWDDRLA